MKGFYVRVILVILRASMGARLEGTLMEGGLSFSDYYVSVRDDLSTVADDMEGPVTETGVGSNLVSLRHLGPVHDR